MTFTEEQVEWIIIEVLRRLRRLGDNGMAAGERDAAAAKSSELTLTERVITLRSIEGKLTHVTKLIVPAKAVVTPAVKDELKAKKVALIVENLG